MLVELHDNSVPGAEVFLGRFLGATEQNIVELIARIPGCLKDVVERVVFRVRGILLVEVRLLGYVHHDELESGHGVVCFCENGHCVLDNIRGFLDVLGVRPQA